MRIGEEVVQLVHRPMWHIVFGTKRHPFLRCARHQNACQMSVKHFHIARALSVVGKAGVCCQFGMPGGGEETDPVRIAVRHEAKVAIEGTEGLSLR